MDEMPFFEIVAPHTYNDTFELNVWCFFHKNKVSIAIFIVFMLMCFSNAVIDAKNGNITNALTGIVIAVVFIIVYVLTMYMIIHSSAKKSCQSAINKDNVNRYYFYQDRMVNIDNNMNMTVTYDKLFEAHETKDYFYIFIENNRAFVIPKKCFTFNTPEEMRKLLTIKLGARFVCHIKY